ncbi:carbamoyl phosphate synthase preATP-grasp domain-containing protein [Fructilactobacillus lindneri]|uniref:ATP-grasp domain-containing protein n=2 Tax=Fructilactobacillus lindneri TaxID=53444 RepID=A0A0R2JPB4_9LACO|nr:ATP-grasp domain-containing protein [Fructilactobacillus lindneri]ANZ58180.1 carbamoyl-phosphate synthase [Fructilactobacillus lindneri]ANZ59501.1 carbamoyl-phosphate synthase [Fructilactobacillus lindneri]KRN79003.1 hypothetical protein IV52_GL000408 [Fructilactobacillus lindneri DSM 20690 = JCM 11027]POG98715.1 carbamoyl-phosphate synthase [Fructilactobacillus lindneri]POH04103.1 carbamoyl-phosphate synthase [Fructilactobacillus lindneri]
MNCEIKNILIIGGGPSDVGHENEQDAAAFQAFSMWKNIGIKTFIIDNNPYSLLLQEVPASDVFVKNINTQNVEEIIKTKKIDAITSIYGKKEALKVIQRLNKNGILKNYNVKIIGLNENNISLFGGIKDNVDNNTVLANRLLENDIPILASNIINDFDELRSNIEKIKFPVSVKPVNPIKGQYRNVFQNVEDLNAQINDIFQQSKVNKISLEKEVGTYKEIGMVAIRDKAGTKMIISSLEDMNPVKVNSTDSVVFAPAQTLNDIMLQQLRATTFKVMDCLGIKGICHIQFAVNSKTDEYYVLKINPFFNQETSIAAKATGYPLAMIVASIIINYSLTEIKLPPKFNKLTPILQPINDHITVKTPIWPFDYLDMADSHLGPHAKATGAAIGVGRSAEAAFMNALRSSQPSPKDVLPSYNYLSEDDLIEQLLHPTDQQLLILYEAVNRGYSTNDLSEITKIDEFFFVIMKNILKIVKFVKDNPLDPKALLAGDRYGFGNGMFCHYWNVSNQTVVYLQENLNNKKTYKMIEPTAGEFIENTDSFYGSYESESDSNQLSNNSALVIGKGRNHLGPNTAADTYTAEMLIQLHKLGYKTIILNNNPNSVSLIPIISDKQYIEPVQLGEILNIIKLEKPSYVFLPGNRHYLIRELSKLKDNFTLIVLPPDQKNGIWNVPKADFAIDLLVSRNEIIPISTVGFKSQEDIDDDEVDKQTDYYIPFGKDALDIKKIEKMAKNEVQEHQLTGLIQVLFHTNHHTGGYAVSGITPLRITETIFLNEVTGINWIKILMQMYTEHFNPSFLKKLIPSIDSTSRFAIMQIIFPFKSLGISNIPKKRDFEIGAKLSFGKSISDSQKNLLK